MNLLEGLAFIGEGIVLTLELTLGGIAFGFVLGSAMAIFRHKNWGNFWINSFISIMRGTPLLLQLSFFYFAIPGLMGIKFSILSAGIITLGLNSSAYISEILRGGIQSLPKGQFEAVRTLQIPAWPMWKDIILPQVLRNTFPSLINQLISLLKDTALISTIGGMDLMRRSQTLAAEYYTYFVPLCIAGLYYYLLVIFIEFIGKKIEMKAKYVKNS